MPTALLERCLPQWHHRSLHRRAMAAAPEAVYTAARTLDFSAAWLTRSLLALRGFGVAQANLAGLQAVLHFSLLAEDAPREFVLGGVYPLRQLSPAQFEAHAAPGLQMAWNFSVAPTATGCELCTETRVRCIGARAQRQFGLYWFVIRPFSGLIRRELLRCVARAVERK